MVGRDNGSNHQRLLIAVCLCRERYLKSGGDEECLAQPLSSQKTAGLPFIHGGVCKRRSRGSKEMRGRIALQSTSCEITRVADLVSQNFGVRTLCRYRCAFSNCLRISAFS